MPTNLTKEEEQMIIAILHTRDSKMEGYRQSQREGYEGGYPIDWDNDIKDYIEALKEQILKTERKRCADIAWNYLVEATRKEEWSKEELLEALNEE